MTDSKLNLPAFITDTNAEIVDDHLTLPPSSDQSSMTHAKLAVATEALRAVTEVVSIIESYLELQTARAMWQGKIQLAEIEIEKIEQESIFARENSAAHRQRIELNERILAPLIQLFEQMMNQLSDTTLKPEDELLLREQLLTLADKMVKLKG